MSTALEILDRHIAEAERKAQLSYDRHKWMMFGYWKAIAVHLRKVRKEIQKGG
jgi:flagellar biosynthesis/type III secretory pathway chaperone